MAKFVEEFVIIFRLPFSLSFLFYIKHLFQFYAISQQLLFLSFNPILYNFIKSIYNFIKSLSYIYYVTFFYILMHTLIKSNKMCQSMSIQNTKLIASYFEALQLIFAYFSAAKFPCRLRHPYYINITY